MIFELLRLSIDVTDETFDSIYPKNIKLLAQRHWTPVSVARTASEFLADRPGTRVLDIGSGAGKFCMVGAAHTKGHFTGIEQRLELVELSRKLSGSYFLRNVSYIHSNILSVNFRNYSAFYLYNSFHENIDHHNRIDDTVELSDRLYDIYSLYTVGQLAALPPGVRLATYHAPITVVPSNFRLIDSLYNGNLKLWEKVF